MVLRFGLGCGLFVCGVCLLLILGLWVWAFDLVARFDGSVGHGLRVFVCDYCGCCALCCLG